MEKVIQFGNNHLEENIQENGKMINIMEKESLFLQMVIDGMAHIKKVEPMVMDLMFLIKNILKIMPQKISFMDMQLKRKKFNHKPIYIEENLEWV